MNALADRPRPAAGPLFLLLLLALPCSSCLAAVAAAAGGSYAYVEYERNGAYRDYTDDFERVWGTTLASLRDLGYPVEFDYRHGPTEAGLEVRDLVVRVTREVGGLTRVRVRAGAFQTEENQRRAELVLERITHRLR